MTIINQLQILTNQCVYLAYLLEQNNSIFCSTPPQQPYPTFESSTLEVYPSKITLTDEEIKNIEAHKEFTDVLALRNKIYSKGLTQHFERIESIVALVSQLISHHQKAGIFLNKIPDTEFIKTAYYIHSLSVRNCDIKSTFIPKRACSFEPGLQASLYINSEEKNAYIIPRKKDSSFCELSDNLNVRGGLKINYETNDIEEISIAKISNETEESRKEKQHLLMFSGALGHVQVHQIFTHPVLDKVDNQYTIKLKNYICTANYGYTLKSAKGLKITPEQKVGICYDLVRGLEYTHLKGIVHNNIDLNSILVQEIKLHRLTQDTEDSKIYHAALSHWRKAYTPYGPKTIREQFYGSVENTAPELIAKNIRFIDKTSLSRECAHDVYALGKTLLTFMLNKEIDALNRLPLYSDCCTIFNEFIRCSTLGERIKWYKSASKSLNDSANLTAKKNIVGSSHAIYKSTKSLIDSNAISNENMLVQQALHSIVEMINPDPTQRPKASNIAQHLSSLLSN